MKRNYFWRNNKRVLGIVMAVAIAITGIPFPASQVSASESSITVGGLTDNSLTVSADTNETISIGNDQLSRTFKIVNGKLTTGTIYNKLAGENVVFTPATGSEEFVIRTLGSEGTRVEPDTPLTSVRPVIESDEEEIPTSPMISVSSSMPNDGGGMVAATDKDANTYWSSNVETANAAYFQVIFAGEKKVTKVDYTPRFDSGAKWNCTGRITGMKFQVYDGTTWTDLTDAEGNAKIFDLGTDNTVEGYPVPVTVDLSDLSVVARGIRVMASASYHWQPENANKVINIAEIDILGVASDAAAGTQPVSLIHVETVEEPEDPAEQKDWVLTGNSTYTNSDGSGDGGGYAALLDGDPTTRYHSEYDGDPWPVTFTLDRGVDAASAPFQTVGYLPRPGGVVNNGAFKTIEVYAADSGDSTELFKEENRLTFADGSTTGHIRYIDALTNEVATNDGNKKISKWIYTALENACNKRYVGIKVLTATTTQAPTNFASGSGLDLFAEKFDSVPASSIYSGEEIKASELELVKVTSEIHETNGGKEGNEGEKTGQLLTFEFKPILWGGQGTATIYQKVVMYEGDHYMRKWVEIKFSDDADKLNRIAYIDGEHLYTTPSTADLNANKPANEEAGKDVIWTIPPNSGDIVLMDEVKGDLGQPVYINGLFMGSEFPSAQNKIEKADVTGTAEAGTRLAISRYYTGKNLSDLERDDHFLNQLTDDNKFVSWQTVLGASRSDGNDQSIVQQDFFSYIRDISTPSDFRIQYNSWYDNMMRITDDNIMEAFKDIDKNFVETGVRPLDSYVIDDGWNVYRKRSSDLQSGLDIERNGRDDVNTAGFWQINSKFPNEFYTSSNYVQKMGSYFGVWIGPRGGYNYNGMLADIIQTGLDTNGDGVKDVQYGSSAGGSIDVADSRYVKKYAEMVTDWTNRFKVNYWKWDGFADQGQYNSFQKGSIETVGYSESNQHMYGGPNGEYHVTDLWEKWIYIMEEVREAAEANGINNLWISLTCYTNPSPWHLQWANSVWIQCGLDRGDFNNGVLTDKMNTMLTYRDAVYHNFIVDHEFQFPLSNIYNHEPIYGKEDTGIDANSMDGEKFRNYMFMQSGRGSAFWELYYSDSILNEEKYLINADFLEWAEENYDLLKHAIMIGNSPHDEITLTNNSGAVDPTKQSVYGYANFSETEADGILFMRNPVAEERTFNVTLDESIGVRFDVEYTMWKEHVYVQNEGQTAATHLVNGVAATNNILRKGDTVSITLKPGETQIWRLKEGGDTTAPVLDKIYFDDANTIQVRASERLDNSNITFTVNGKAVPAENVTKYADLRTFIITLDEEMMDGNEITVATANGTDNAGNALAGSISAKYYKNNRIAVVRNIKKTSGTVSPADRSVVGDQGFAVSADVVYGENNVELLKQGDNYVLGINAKGQPYFTVNGVTATSDMVMTEGQSYGLSGIRENNGYVRLYIDNQIDKAAYDKSSVGFVVEAAPITYATGNNTLKNVIIHSAAVAYDELPEAPLKVSSNVYVVDQDAKSITISDAKTTAGELLAGLVYQDDVTVVVERNGVVLTAGTRVAEGDVVTVTVAGETVFYTILVVEDGTAKKIPQSSMRVTAGSEENSASTELTPATNAIDGKTNTIWHSAWGGTAAENKWITIELTEDYSITGYEYTPRNGGNTNGIVTSYEIYTSNTNNGSDWVLVAKGNDWAENHTVKTVMFEQPVQAKYVKLLAKESVGGFVSAAEINLFGERSYTTDTEQPSAPVLTANQVGGKTVELCWTESSDGENGSGVNEYYLKQNGEEIARFGANAREYIVGGLQPETEYSFEIVAVDRAGNEASSEIIKVTTAINAEVLGYSLSLGGTIGVNFHMKLGATVLADKDAYMKFKLGGKELEPIYVKDIIPTTVDGVDYYVFKCEVPVKDMETEITAQIVLSDGRNSSEFKYTVKEYADKIEDKINKGEVLPDATPELIDATVELVEAMSDFGNYATTYFAEGTLEETEEMKEVTFETLESYQGTLPAGENSIYYGSSLLLKSDTIIRHYFTEKVDGSTQKGNLYYIETEGIPAHALGTEVITRVGDITIEYSPLSYAYIALSRESVDENLRSVMRAMYLYYEAAQAYKDAATN